MHSKSWVMATILMGGTIVPALSADFPTSSPPYAPYAPYTPYRAFDWTGPYIGLNLGYQFGDVGNTSFRPRGFAGGIEGGYNWQIGNFVLGAETDLQLSDADDTFAAYKFSNPWFGTLRARGGIALNNTLLYLTGGLAYGEGKLQYLGWTETHTHFGWTFGGGIEVGFTPSWSVKAEYLYVDLSERSYGLDWTNSDLQSNILRLGVNYRF